MSTHIPTAAFCYYGHPCWSEEQVNAIAADHYRQALEDAVEACEKVGEGKDPDVKRIARLFAERILVLKRKAT